METKAEIYKASLDRIMKIKKGDPVTNICAGEGSPIRLVYFVGLVKNVYKNKYGVIHVDQRARCTDKKGNTWNTAIEVVYPGHIGYEESCKLFEPIHAALFSNVSTT